MTIILMRHAERKKDQSSESEAPLTDGGGNSARETPPQSQPRSR